MFNPGNHFVPRRKGMGIADGPCGNGPAVCAGIDPGADLPAFIVERGLERVFIAPGPDKPGLRSPNPAPWTPARASRRGAGQPDSTSPN